MWRVFCIAVTAVCVIAAPYPARGSAQSDGVPPAREADPLLSVAVATAVRCAVAGFGRPVPVRWEREGVILRDVTLLRRQGAGGEAFLGARVRLMNARATPAYPAFRVLLYHGDEFLVALAFPPAGTEPKALEPGATYTWTAWTSEAAKQEPDALAVASPEATPTTPDTKPGDGEGATLPEKGQEALGLGAPDARAGKPEGGVGRGANLRRGPMPNLVSSGALPKSLLRASGVKAGIFRMPGAGRVANRGKAMHNPLAATGMRRSPLATPGMRVNPLARPGRRR